MGDKGKYVTTRIVSPKPENVEKLGTRTFVPECNTANQTSPRCNVFAAIPRKDVCRQKLGTMHTVYETGFHAQFYTMRNNQSFGSIADAFIALQHVKLLSKESAIATLDFQASTSGWKWKHTA